LFSRVTVYAKDDGGPFASLCTDNNGVVDTLSVRVYQANDATNNIITTVIERNANVCVFDSVQNILLTEDTSAPTADDPPVINMPRNKFLRAAFLKK